MAGRGCIGKIIGCSIRSVYLFMVLDDGSGAGAWLLAEF